MSLTFIGKTETERLLITDAFIEECDELQEICETWDDKKLMEGEDFEPGYIRKCLTEGDLPPIPGASKENYRLKSFHLKESGRLIGFTDLYFGYPTEKTAWISIFLISKVHRKEGFAQEAIEAISTECIRAGFDQIGIGVYLKNLRGLRFWIKAGFREVTGISADAGNGENAFALIRLIKKLR
ncbi:MAG: GNAT family N-acetyltransferase [Bacteroidales bacterium]|nr:GNAT family N-acetyltransferase [Bacteroidales bacterium]